MQFNNNPKVSVIIPNYNYAQYLKQRIESVLQQTYNDIEVIILDDCSSDNSREIIENYKNLNNVQIHYNIQNSGSVYKQWEKGINLAKGEFIWIAESDDYADIHLLEQLVPVIESDNEIGLVYCDTNILISDKFAYTSSSQKNKRDATTKWSKNYTIDGKQEIIETLVKRCSINNTSGVVFRKSVLMQILPLKYNFKISGDYFIYLNIANRYKISYISSALNFYRYHDNNASSSYGDTYLQEFFLIYKWIFSNCTDYLSNSEIGTYFAKTMIYPLTLSKSLIPKYIILWLLKKPLYVFFILKELISPKKN